MTNASGLYLSFQTTRSPHRDLLRAHLLRWLADSSLSAASGHVVSAQIDELIAAVYPTAERTELELIGELIVWMFLFDDQFDVANLGCDAEHSDTVTKQVADILRDERGKQHVSRAPLLRALCIIVRRFESAQSELWKRISEDLTIFVTAVAREVEQRVHNDIPQLADYADQRLETFAWAVLVDLIEFAQGRRVPERLRKTHEYQTLVRSAGLVMCGVNDVFSLTKELRSKEKHNLVLILMHETGRCLDESVADAEALILSHVESFLAHADAISDVCRRMALPPLTHMGVMAHVSGLRSLIEGQFNWCRITSRYQLEPSQASDFATLQRAQMILAKGKT